MNNDELKKHLSDTWMREQSADDAHDKIWGEPFDGYTIPVSEKVQLERENARLLESIRSLHGIATEGAEYGLSDTAHDLCGWNAEHGDFLLPNAQGEPLR